MATNTFSLDLLNPEQTEVIQSGVASYTAGASTPANLNQVSPAGTVVSGALPQLTAWASTTAKQNPLARDVTVYVECAFDGTANAASVAIAISADNSTYSTVGTPSVSAAVNTVGATTALVPVRLPVGWWIKLTFGAHVVVAQSFYT